MDDLTRQLPGLPASTLSDALDRLGIPGQIPHTGPLDRSFRLAGPAYTLRYRSSVLAGQRLAAAQREFGCHTLQARARDDAATRAEASC